MSSGSCDLEDVCIHRSHVHSIRIKIDKSCRRHNT